VDVPVDVSRTTRRLRRHLPDAFRLPTEQDPAPEPRHLAAVCAIAAFASVHKRRLPFALLGVASVSLVLGWIVTGL
jgi:hypothetical protein